MMLRYAKIIRFPGAFAERYEYRYRCCEKEYRMKFRRVFKGERKGKYRKLSSEGFDLRRREAPLFPTDHCTECGIQIPQPWLSPNEDAFLADVLSGDIRAVAAKQEKENGRT